MTAPPCGWNPTSFSPNCDWDPTCPHHGEPMIDDNLPLAPGIAPAPQRDPDWVAKHSTAKETS